MKPKTKWNKKKKKRKYLYSLVMQTLFSIVRSMLVWLVIFISHSVTIFLSKNEIKYWKTIHVNISFIMKSMIQIYLIVSLLNFFIIKINNWFILLILIRQNKKYVAKCFETFIFYRSTISYWIFFVQLAHTPNFTKLDLTWSPT